MKLGDEKIVQLITEELNKTEVKELIQQKLKDSMPKELNDVAKKDKEFEKRIKEIVSDVIVDMFRVLWMHNNIFKSLGR